MTPGFHTDKVCRACFDLSFNCRRRPQRNSGELATQILYKLKYSRSEIVAISFMWKRLLDLAISKINAWTNIFKGWSVPPGVTEPAFVTNKKPEPANDIVI